MLIWRIMKNGDTFKPQAAIFHCLASANIISAKWKGKQKLLNTFSFLQNRSVTFWNWELTTLMYLSIQCHFIKWGGAISFTNSPQLVHVLTMVVTSEDTNSLHLVSWQWWVVSSDDTQHHNQRRKCTGKSPWGRFLRALLWTRPDSVFNVWADKAHIVALPGKD